MPAETLYPIVIFGTLGLLVAALIAVKLINRSKRKRRTKTLAGYADAMHLKFAEKDPWNISSIYPSLILLQMGGEVSNVLWLDTPEEGGVRLFDYEYITERGIGRGRSVRFHYFSVCLVIASQKLFPSYVLVRRKRFIDDFAPGRLKKIGFDEYPEFRKKFYVKSIDRECAKQFLASDIVDYITTSSWKGRVSIEADENVLAIYTKRCKKKEDFTNLFKLSSGLMKLIRAKQRK